MSHTIDFFKRKFAELNDFATSKGIMFPYANLDEFISDYKDVSLSSKNVMKDMKYNLQYETSYKTALSELRVIRELGDTETKLVELKRMGTREFAELHKDDIMFDYEVFKKYSGSAKGALAMISRYWFGSE